MTINIPKEVENSINAAVQSGLFPSVEDAVTVAWVAFDQQLKHAQTSRPSPSPETPAAPYKPIWEVAEEIRKQVPPEEWAKLPADGARQLDHYIYGTPKRPPA